MTLLMREREKYKEGYAEGELAGEARGAKGIIEFAIDLGYTNEETISVLQRKLAISESKAENYLKKFYEESVGQ